MTVCAVLAAGFTATTVQAEELSGLPDDTRKGSITVDVISADTGEAISGGAMTLYEVAEAKREDGEMLFGLTGPFEESGIALTDVSEWEPGMKDLAAELEIYVQNHKIEGKAAEVDEKGQAVWPELESGLYLVLHTDPAEGCDPVNAFLITVPRYVDGAYLYQVEAAPKAGTAKTSAQKPSDSDSVPVKSSARALAGGRLPQTGQLWWPVPALAFAGILFVMAGWYRRRCCEKNNGECQEEKA